MAYDFHYTPTGTGVISGKEVLEQTEDAINDLGNTAISGVQEALDKAEQALTNSENAVDDAQTALNTANNAEGVAIQAQTDVGNLSGTVTNIGNRVTTAEGNITNLQGRMTTAEGNITNLQGRMTTAEGNIGNLQTAVSTAQATANSAQQTATTARQQSYVFRYSGTAITDNSTIAYSTIDNTDNIKSGDKILDVDGKLFEITAVDTTNQTVTVGTALIDLANDSDVVHKSGNETVAGVKTFTDSQNLTGYTAIRIYSPNDEVGVLPSTTQAREIRFTDKNNVPISYFAFQHRASSDEPFRTCWRQQKVDGTSSYYSVNFNNLGEFYPENNNPIKLGTSTNPWAGVYATNYYYGSNNVEFSDKFVTTDTNQTVGGSKTFSDMSSFQGSYLGNETSTNARTELVLRSNRDTAGQSGIFLTKFRQNKAQGALSGNDVVYLTLDILENSVRTNTVFRFNFRNFVNDIPQDIAFYPTGSKNSLGGNADGSSNNKWHLINGLEPSSLGMPDLSNGIDISSYLDTSQSSRNYYTPSVNGWISIKGRSSSGTNGIVIMQGDFCQMGQSVVDLDTTDRVSFCMLPVMKNVQVEIWLKSVTSLDSAKFFPCQGNI